MRNPRRNSRWVAPSASPDLLGEDRPNAELAGRLEREDDPAGRRAGHHVDHGLAVAASHAGGPQAAQLAGRGRILEHLELLDVGVAVAAALEQEMALSKGAGVPEDALRAQGDRAPCCLVDGGSNRGHETSLVGQAAT